MSNKYKNLEDFVENLKIFSNDFFKKHTFEDGRSLEILRAKSWMWHEPIDVVINSRNVNHLIQSTETNSGCGLINISNYYYFNNKKDLMSIIKIFIEYYTFKKVGALFTTIGDSTSTSTLEAFTDSGFVEITEYVNPLHGTNYKQKLLLLVL